MRLTREPAVLWIGLLVPIVQAITAFLLDGSPETAGVVNAAAVAVAGAITAAMVRSDRLLPALVGAVQALFAVAVAFGLDWSAEQQALVLAPIALVLSIVVRDRVTAPVPDAVTPTVRAA